MRKLILPLLLLGPVSGLAATPEEKGLEIAREAERRDDGFKDTRSELVMILRDKSGGESLRRMRSKVLEVPGDGDKSLLVFDNPKDVQGTAFLTYSHKEGNDDQWLYLPALKRVKRISSSNRSGSFMGSEFTYEDLASHEVEKYSYKWLRDEPCPTEVFAGMDCFVVERYPVTSRSGYTRIVDWLDKKEYRLAKAEFFDRKKSHLKTLTVPEHKQFLKRFWRPMEMHMVNHQNGKSTRLRWKDFRFQTGFKESDFSRSALKRVR